MYRPYVGTLRHIPFTYCLPGCGSQEGLSRVESLREKERAVKRAIAAAAILTGLPLTTAIMTSSPASAAPPPPPGATTARSELAALKVKKEISLSGYSRA